MSLNFMQIAPYLGAVGNELINLDENLEGADDYAGNLLMYVAEVGTAIQNREDIPEIPEIIQKGVSGKLSSGVRATLRLASTALTIAQFQVTGKAQTIIKYLNQVLRALLANQPVPTTPKTLIDELKRPLDRDHNVALLNRVAAKVDELGSKPQGRDKLENRLTEIEEILKSLRKHPALIDS